MLSSSDGKPGAMPVDGDGSAPPGKEMSLGQKMVDKGAQMMQSLNPMKQVRQHVCTFAFYSHDMSRQIETHHYVSRLNQDFLQCAVYDSDHPHGRLIGIEYIVSDKIFQTLDPEEQKLWHSHAYEIASGLWLNPGVPETLQKPELRTLAKSYGKFWCTWQVDRGDTLPLGPPALMMSPQVVNVGTVTPELVQMRDAKYKVSIDKLKESRADIDISVPENQTAVTSNADYWLLSGKGFAIDVESTEMKKLAPFP